MKTTKESDLVVRHNNLINANIRLDAKEYDIVRTFMKYITRDDGDFWTFSVRASDLNINKSRGAPMVRSIQRKPVEIELPNDGLVSIPFFTILKYSDGVFEGKFNNDLRDVLLEMKGNFTKTYEKYILPMDSIYAKRIYELLSENISIGYRKFKLEDLYKILQVPKSMKSYSRFKEKVLLISIKEINKHTDIYIPIDTTNLTDGSWIKLQCGVKRGVTHLNFEFRKKSDKSFTETQKIEESVSQEHINEQWKLTQHWIDDLMVEFGVAQTVNQQLMNEFELYLYEQEKVFSQFCTDNNKQYEDMNISFQRHLKNAEAYKIDFFARLR
jgi:plasmid replication initiation protein